MRIRVYSRGDVSPQAQWKKDPQSNQWILVADQGVRMIVDGLSPPEGNIPGLGREPIRLDISTDRLVYWTTSANQPDLTGQAAQDENQPREVYLEGNVVFLQGDRVIRRTPCTTTCGTTSAQCSRPT